MPARRGMLGLVKLIPHRGECARWALGLLLCGLPAAGDACIWFHGTDLQGFRIEVNSRGPEDFVLGLQPERSFQYWKEARESFAKREDHGDDFKTSSDRAALLIFTGEFQPAIEILEGIETAHPGEYITAANLGTAYELAGDSEKALRWIRRCIELNPNSHYGTEWLHVRILEAQLACKADPAWLATHSVLGVEFGDGELPAAPATTGPRARSLDKLQQALEY